MPGCGFEKSADPRTGRGAGKLSLTRTGSNFMAGLRSPSLPARYNRRQPNTWLALMPCPRATRATDAPSTRVSSTIRRFSAILRRCRGAALNNSPLLAIPSVTCREVSISAPSGHLFRKCPLRQNDFLPARCPDGHNRTLTVMSGVHKSVAEWLGLRKGRYVHFVDSLHYHKKYCDLVRRQYAFMLTDRAWRNA